MILMYSHAKVVWMGYSLKEGEKWCHDNHVEWDYIATLSYADYIKLCAMFKEPCEA
jgi:hypothetical protein